MHLPVSDKQELSKAIKALAAEHGFDDCGIADTSLGEHLDHYRQWLDNQYHGDMSYMADRKSLRENPQELHPNTISVISVRMDYLPKGTRFIKTLGDPNKAFVSRYALGRDYHKLIRKRLQKFGDAIKKLCEDIDFRGFVDSAPVLERAFAEKAGIGWIGKNTMLLHRNAGSFFFLGELFTNLPLASDEPVKNECGECQSCINLCPTNAIVGPYQIDARKCISYLTIEHYGAIPEDLRPLMGNRIYGCDDCQLVCPINQATQITNKSDFSARNGLDDITLIELSNWNEKTFLDNFAGSPIRRIGFLRWQRNLSIALGNAPYTDNILSALLTMQENQADPMVLEHIEWAIQQQRKKRKHSMTTNVDKQHKKMLRAGEKIMAKLEQH